VGGIPVHYFLTPKKKLGIFSHYRTDFIFCSK
jgi:hypothetical protein